MTPEQLKAIKPRKDFFYSPRLYSWLKWFSEKRFAYEGVQRSNELMPVSILSRLEVRKIRKGPCSGDPFIVLEFESRFTGHRIKGIRIDKRNESYAYLKKDFGPPVKSFWQNYIKKGVCYLNPEHHWIDGPDAWEYSADCKTRTCRWCGLKQREKSKTVKKVEKWWEVAV